LIQHGELDRRVPIANAYELRQALEDRGVKVEMIVYKGFGHGITKPKSQRAVMQHNLGWFNHYIWNDPLPDFTNPDLPRKESKEADRKATDPVNRMSPWSAVAWHRFGKSIFTKGSSLTKRCQNKSGARPPHSREISESTR
jgi:acetyl esterase/lipase